LGERLAATHIDPGSIRSLGFTQPVYAEPDVHRGWKLIRLLHSHELAQLIAPTRQTRADCPNWHTQGSSRPHRSACLRDPRRMTWRCSRGRLSMASPEVAQLEYVICVRCHKQEWGRSFDLDADSLADGAAHVVLMLGVQDSEEPGSQSVPACHRCCLATARARPFERDRRL
jgi:hypothetical protein